MQRSELEHLEANYRSTRERIGRGRRLCMTLIFLCLAFFITLTGVVLFGPTGGKTYFLNSSFVLTVVSLACTAMLLVGTASLLFWFFLTRLRIRLENNHDNIRLHLVLASEHLSRERAALARELQGYSSVSEAIIERAADRIREQGKRKSELLTRCDELHLLMDQALRYFNPNAKQYETE